MPSQVSKVRAVETVRRAGGDRHLCVNAPWRRTRKWWRGSERRPRGSKAAGPVGGVLGGAIGGVVGVVRELPAS